MNQNKHLEKSLGKDPYLKLRYSRGLGDIISCILHSKALSWLTFLLTKQKRPCNICAQRATALNTLFPISLWKLFFNSEEEAIESLKKDLIKAGYVIEELTKESTGFVSSKIEIKELEKNTNMPEQIVNTEEQIINIAKQKNDSNEYIFLSSEQNFFGEYMVKIEFFRKK
jgi:hypothetical protein